MVLVFVVLNAIGFLAYRALAAPGVAAAKHAAPAATTVDTFSRAKPTRQLKLDALANDAVVAPATSSQVDAPPATSAPATVTGDAETHQAEGAKQAEVAQQAKEAHRAQDPHDGARPRRERHPHEVRTVSRHSDRTPARAARSESAPSKSSTDAKQPAHGAAANDASAAGKPKPKDKLLDMEANPYKQRE